MAGVEHRGHARAFLTKAEEYLASAEDNLAAGRYTPAAADAVHAGISAKDAILTPLTGVTGKGKAHAAAAEELKTALGRRPDATSAARALRELISAKTDVEYGTTLVTRAEAEPLVRRAARLSSSAPGSSASAAEGTGSGGPRSEDSPFRGPAIP